MPFKAVPEEFRRVRLYVTLRPETKRELERLSRVHGVAISRIIDAMVLGSGEGPKGEARVEVDKFNKTISESQIRLSELKELLKRADMLIGSSKTA